MTAQRRLQTWGEVAQFFGISLATARRWEKLYNLPVHKGPGPRSQIVADVQELKQWEAQHIVPPMPE